MAEGTIIKKLGIKPGYKVLILNAPPGYAKSLGALPDGATIAEGITPPGGQFDLVQYFAHDKAEVDQNAQAVIHAVKMGGLLWFSYPKKTGKIKTDLSRDVGWDSVAKAGWIGVSLISIDDTWSSMRYRPASEVKSTRKS